MDVFKAASPLLKWISRNKITIVMTSVTFILFTILVAELVPKNPTTCELCTTEVQALKDELNLSGSVPVVHSFRLPKNVKPTKYVLKLWPILQTKTYNGTVTIFVEVLNSTKSIRLHTKDLNIESVILEKVHPKEFIVIESFNVNKILEILEIKLNQTLSEATYGLNVKFNGGLDKKIIGFYASTLRDGRTMVASKFQPTYARQAFPCFDEPEFKATYDITLVKPTDYVALSNMNELSSKYDKETNSDIVTFATSVPMSTYLACFVICNFDYKETEIKTNGIGKNFTLRSFAQKNETHKIDFAQSIGKRATEFYINYYQVPFPLPKLDMIAIPDYVSGATEHWGLVTYRETSFLVDEKVASSRNKMNVANTIAHELAHMWFGNLVTMKWWDEVWLNEGFASYMQVKALNAIEPSWTMLDQFLTKTLHSVLTTDAKVSSHPIVQTVDTPDQITAIFDSISYNKGASVLRMLEGFIGEENFRKGVSDYLKKFEFGNTVTQDLLTCLEEYFKVDQPDMNLTHIMNTWTRQMGYPVLDVTVGDSNTYVITQKRFLLDPAATMKETSEYNYRWFVPITYKTSEGPKGNILWFPDTADSVTISLKEHEKWIKLNNNQVGYYRVNYPVQTWEQLKELLMNGSEYLTTSDRAHLLNDAFALAEAGTLPYGVALDLTPYLRRERGLVPWQTAGAVLSKLSDNLMNSPAHHDFERYVQHLVRALYEKQTWEKVSLSVIDGLFRAKILSLATTYHLPQAEAKVKELFLEWLNSHGTAAAVDIETDLRDFVYFCGMKSASLEEWNKLWDVYIKEQDVQEQSKLRGALSASRNVDILRRFLTLAWDEKNIRSQDYLGVLSYVGSNPSGSALVWDEVRARWPQLVERFTLNSRYLGSLIPDITSSFNTEAQLKEMEEFFQKYPEAGAGEAARRTALENVRQNIKWSNTHLQEVTEWLANYIKTLN